MRLSSHSPQPNHLKSHPMKSTTLLGLAAFLLAVPAANASIVLYSSSFAGSSGTNLNGTTVTTSGATGAQHTQYGTSASATWTATTAFKANGSFVESGAFNSTANRVSATLVFTPQNGFVYNLTMTTSFTQVPTVGEAAFHSVGYFETAAFSGNINSATGSGVWALTRPGDTTTVDQVAHYNVTGGAGNVGQLAEDPTAPSTLRITLDTTGGAGNWAATYYVGNGSGGFNLLGSVADLNAVTIGSVGIGVYNADGAANFQSLELSVVPEPSAMLLSGLGMLGFLRRRR
jgi:hypothetical protein